ncbi:MAG TPA: hypothetical protein VN616_03150 [Puia sp.]|nr:hypothetical protein [Puia sp.]
MISFCPCSKARPARNTFRFLLVLILLAAGTARAQKGWPGDINALIARVPIPASSGGCYAPATKITDPSTGIVTIKDNGESFNSLQAQLDGIIRDAVAGTSVSPASPPSADQIEQMKQQAMARAAAAQAQAANPQQMAHQQSYSGSAPGSSELALMKMISQAQMAASRIGSLCNEIAMKKSKITRDSVDAVKQGPNCPEVQQGGYAGPTCACLKAHAIDYYTRRVTRMDTYVAEVAALIREYMPKIKAEESIIDEAEAKAKYGDAFMNPTYKQMAVSVQRQAFAGLTTLFALAGDAWNDGAVEYANLANATSGAMTRCQ